MAKFEFAMLGLIMAALLGVLIFALVHDGEAETKLTDTGGIVVSNVEGSAGITEFTLKDGTRCAALIGYYKGALSCDWK